MIAIIDDVGKARRAKERMAYIRRHRYEKTQSTGGLIRTDLKSTKAKAINRLGYTNHRHLEQGDISNTSCTKRQKA